MSQELSAARLDRVPHGLDATAASGTRVRGVACVVSAGGAQLLTARQLTAVGLRARGYTYDEVAQRMGIRNNTARAHVKFAEQRLGAESLLELLVALGWLRVPEEVIT